MILLHFAGVYQSNSNCAWKYYGKESITYV